MFLRRLCALVGTARTAFVALVQAKENVMLVIRLVRHVANVPWFSFPLLIRREGKERRGMGLFDGLACMKNPAQPK
jgi:hypothetical protein